MTDINAWLTELGLDAYAQRFAENHIDFTVIRELTDQDLEKLGVASLGHRRKLLRAIAEIGKDKTPKVDAFAAAETRDTAERRQITVIFCDLVGSTALSVRHDPEDLRAIIDEYHRCCAAEITRFGGWVAQYLGDGVVAYFGYPQAHEDDAERTVRAGLALIEALVGLSTPERLRVRIGIATGLVVTGERGDLGTTRELGVFGETPNLAARLQSLATSDSIVIDANTRRLLGRLFEYRELGPVEVKGFDMPLAAYEVLRPSIVQSRFEALHDGRLTPLVGREEEIELVLRRWAQAKNGGGRVVLLSGEPGIGKSRIIAAIRERLEGDYTFLRYFCSPHTQDSALRPAIAQLERAAGFEPGDKPERKLDKLEALLARISTSVEDVLLLAELLSIPTAERYPVLDLTPQRKREKTFQALLRQLDGLASQRPVLLIFEDVHWIDPTSHELLDRTVERVERLPVLLLVTFRPEFIARWIGQPHVTVLALNRLMQHESVMLIERIRGNQALSAELIEDIIERTDGVPLFIEELTKAVLEASGSGEKSSGILSTLSPTALAVPATLHSSLMARIDRLGMSVKEIVQIGAVIGREFTYPLLAALARRGDSELQTALDHLAESGLVFRRGIPPDATYIFKHALVHDSAYASLLRSHRQQLHATLGQIIEERFTSVSETQPEIVAQHYAKGGITAKAVSYWLKAGQFACARSANAEAEAHLLKGMKLLRELPEGLERDRRELELQCAIGPVMIARKGYSAADSLGAYERARELLIETGDVAHRDEVLTGLVVVFANRGTIDAALQAAKEMLRFAEASGNHTSLCIAHRCTGALYLLIGQISRGQHHAARAVEFYDESRDWNVGFRFGHDIGVAALCQASFAYWLSGLPDSSARMASRALELARKLKHANSQAYAAAWASLLFAFNRRDVAALERDAMQLIAFAREQGLPQFEAWATCFGALPLIDQGSAEEAVRKVRGGIAACESIQNWLFRPVFGAILARAYAAANRDQDALRAISEALDAAERFGQQWMCPELWRIRGVVLSSSQESEECFRHAIDVARKQESRLLELRAATSLARMWYDQGQCDKACELLAPVYGWFTEGFDTADLMEAKALLNYMDGTVICDEDKAARKQF